MPSFMPQPDLTIDIQKIGVSREPIMIIDHFLSDPNALVIEAARSQNWRDLPPGGYPGRRAPLPRDYARAVLERLDKPIRQCLVGGDRTLRRFDCSFSLVTSAPTELTPLQRIPHIDIANENRVAVLHYLCGERFGGTAFFRQLSTGFEQIKAADKVDYVAARATDLSALHSGGGYPGEDTPGYRLTATVKARFNRIIAYRSMTLHSGIIDDPTILSVDPAQGRLTANFFVDYGVDP